MCHKSYSGAFIPALDPEMVPDFQSFDDLGFRFGSNKKWNHDNSITCHYFSVLPPFLLPFQSSGNLAASAGVDDDHEFSD